MIPRRPGRRRRLEPAAAQLVPHAHPQRIDPGQDVELGEGKAVDARECDRVAHEDPVEPAAAPGATRRRSVFVAVGTQPLAERVGQLGREGAAPDPGGVRLGDPDDPPDRARWEPCARRRGAGDDARGGDERIGPVVDVEHRAVRTLEEHALACGERGT